MKEEETTYHVPVLLKESVDAMNITPDGTYVDVPSAGEDIPAKYFRVLETADACWVSIRTRMPNVTL